MPSSFSDRHDPVLKARVTELLSPALSEADSVYVDGTLGLGGHAEAILSACPQARLIGIDRDADALEVAAKRLAPFGERVNLVRARYDELPGILDELDLPLANAMLLDLGLSSLQIDRRERGFAYAADAPLDMRMDTRQRLTAAQVLNTYGYAELRRILREYGEERFADRIARAIIAEREKQPFQTSARLTEVLSSAIPAAARKSGGHPAKRTFQALRIEVNAELESLKKVLPAALARLTVGGRLAVLAYHSLEDRLVKELFRAEATDKAPRGLPVVPEELQPRFRLVTRGAERPDVIEKSDNPRSASARLRVIERTKEDS